MEKYNYRIHLIKNISLSSFLHNRYNDLVVADTIRNFSLSLISLFIPIFLLDKGFLLQEIIFFELFLFVGAVLLHYLTLFNISKWGVRRVLFASYLLNVILYFVLYNNNVLMDDLGKYYFLSIIAVLNIFTSTFYWTAHHVYFVKSTDIKNNGKKLGFLYAIPTIFGIASPFVGSALITEYGFNGAFLVSGILMIIASIVLTFSSKIEVEIKMCFYKVMDWKNKKKNFVYFVHGLNGFAAGFVWPIFLFYMSIQIVLMGSIYLISGTMYAVMTYFVGNMVDKKGNRKLGQVGVMGHGLSLILRSLSTTIFSMTTFQTMGGLFGALMSISVDSGFFKKTYSDIGCSIMCREVYMHLGRMTLAIILLVCLVFYSPLTSLIIALILAGVTTFLLSLIIQKEDQIFN